jgi:hypothetical protein
MLKYRTEKEHQDYVHDVQDGKTEGFNTGPIMISDVTELNNATTAITLHHARMIEKAPKLTSALLVTTPPPKVVDDISMPARDGRIPPKDHVTVHRTLPVYVVSLKLGAVNTPQLRAAHEKDIASYPHPKAMCYIRPPKKGETKKFNKL